jgi:N-acetyl sugar amidotransferase
MKSCSRCLNTETADTISFNTAGTCSVCVQVEHKLDDVDWRIRKVELNNIVSEAELRQGQYDCIVPFSGGKDSTYQLWYVVTQLKLRPLVVRYNHMGYRPQVEANNVRTFKRLGVEVLDFRPNWKVIKATMLEALVRKGDSCWHCHTGVYSFPMHMALRFKTPLIFWGESLKEYQSWLDPTAKENVDEVRFNRAMNLGMTADDMFEFVKDANPDLDRRDFIWHTYPPKAELDALKVQSICLGDYVKWDTKGQVEIIKRELGWEGDEVEGIPPEFDYEKIECQFQGVRDWLKYIKRGFGRTNHLANIEIRHGRMTRERGEQLAQTYDGREPKSLGWFLQTVGITREDFYEIALSHVVDPWEGVDPDNVKVDLELWDMEEWA